jgi:hypothetical protein
MRSSSSSAMPLHAGASHCAASPGPAAAQPPTFPSARGCTSHTATAMIVSPPLRGLLIR